MIKAPNMVLLEYGYFLSATGHYKINIGNGTGVITDTDTGILFCLIKKHFYHCLVRGCW